MVCQKLVAIVPGVQKWGSREREWSPVEHNALSGQRCTGTGKPIR